MYLSELKLWNFRKYGSAAPFDRKTPHLTIPFKNGINVLTRTGPTDLSVYSLLGIVTLLVTNLS